MSGFDTVIVVDWSAAQGVRPIGKDAIWIGVVSQGEAEEPVHMPTRLAAEAWLADRLRAEIATGRRVLAGFDFPFGYPAGFARQVTGSDDPLVLWDWLAERIEDDAKGVNNRFEIASQLNRIFTGVGPFWGKPWQWKERFDDIPFKGTDRTQTTVAEKRACDTVAKASSSVWQLNAHPTVGGQALMGLPMLSRLRRIDGVAVWPFQDWRDAPAVLAEIWPGLIESAVPKDGIRDRHQVRLLAHVLAALPADELAAMMQIDAPEEGWILGAEHRDHLTGLARNAPPEAYGARVKPDHSDLTPPPLSNDCFALPPGVDWTPVDTALDLLRKRLRGVTGTESVAVLGADGRILASAVNAIRANPPAPNAAVDGYGFAHSATGDGAQSLPLTNGRAAAGAPFTGTVPQGHAIRILTGAILPNGVDTVVLEEDTRTDATHVAFNGPVKPGANTRRAGEDVDVGAPLFDDGHRLTPPDLALLSATGSATVLVRKRLRVGVLSTGDELASPGATEDPARTYDANRPMLLAIAARWGHEAVDLGHVADNRDILRAALDAADCHAILTSGGASAGDEDHVSALLRDEGALSSWRIALKPGRPLALGMRGGVPVFGLPGNPVAAFVCALIFARPALSVLAGGTWVEPEGFTVPADFSKMKKPGRREYLRARMGPDGVQVFGSEGSGRISGLSWADGLVELKEGAATITPGDPVHFLPYASFGLV
ncbi:Molybdopterin molybdenumtransferase [Rhodobacteraceae bacterium THAF1]|uniref:molybdopterin-binding protein n=1 Tax=Palleronia sp. THAF1 TaxID=2587842 RepID=UPI000F4187F2|nr:molybdopterin-binding protein [Palleronia sp. THAF1]QFU09823.1 Molybdopterin molybdenumtransferase [Palleronia sp. THAF1]VDC17274.1 Molybdopterin molybdenumtransferase [Rhodobacteraceae bacterium THAF1]